jgi:hypothetical protein
LAQEVNLTCNLTPKAAQARTNALCRSAGELVTRAVEPTQARRLYLRALRTGARNTTCAANGLARIAENAAAAKVAGQAAVAPTTVTKASALLREGYGTEADKLITDLLIRQPAADIPSSFRTDKRLIAVAEGLAAEGYETEAQEKVRDALAANPRVTVPQDLQKFERKPGWLRRRLGWGGGWLVTAALIVIALFIAAAIGRIVWSHLKRRIYTDPLAGGDDKWRDAIYAEMRQRFQAWGQGRTSNRLTASAGPEQKLTLPANVAGLVPQANAVLDLLAAIDRVLPNRSWQLNGHLLPKAPEHGVGLALTLSRKTGGKILDAVTLREAEFLARPDEEASADAQAVAWQRLGLAGAAFVLFADSARRRFFPDHYRLLGTHDWRAYAMATSAATFYEWDLPTARRLYRQAIARDQSYIDAEFGLAVVDIRLAGGDIKALRDVENDLAKLLPKVRTNEALWYRIQFWRVVAQLQQGTYEPALYRARCLFTYPALWWTPPNDLKDFLDDTMPSSLVLLAAALELTRRPLEGDLAGKVAGRLKITTPVTGKSIVDALVTDPDQCSKAAYGLAGYYAICQGAGWVDHSLEQLRIALERGGPDLARTAWNDHMLNGLRRRHVKRFEACLAEAGFTPNGAHDAARAQTAVTTFLPAQRRPSRKRARPPARGRADRASSAGGRRAS